jgi:hypothetical protein
VLTRPSTLSPTVSYQLHLTFALPDDAEVNFHLCTKWQVHTVRTSIMTGRWKKVCEPQAGNRRNWVTWQRDITILAQFLEDDRHKKWDSGSLPHTSRSAITQSCSNQVASSGHYTIIRTQHSPPYAARHNIPHILQNLKIHAEFDLLGCGAVWKTHSTLKIEETFLRNVRSNKTHTGPHPRRQHS